MSSPHTRGSSAHVADVHGIWVVVPAHAGVIRPTPELDYRCRCRPRTRGGHPSTRRPWRWRATSSPHTRGSSDRVQWACRSVLVVPAHAGVILPESYAISRHQGRPRTRGGHPAGRIAWQRDLGSSPHTRGSSVVHAVERGGDPVVPAHAGVILHRREPGTVPGRSSPHTRGSSAHRQRFFRRFFVVPAHAGVIRRG